MTDYLRFLFTPADRDRIDPASIQVDITPFDPAPANASARWPESLRIRFRVQDPANGAPQLRMIFPGKVRHLPDALTAGQALPTPTTINFTGTNVEEISFNNWPNQGSVRVQASPRDIINDLTSDNKLTGIGLPPLNSWFGPVEITRDFINDTVLNGVEKQPITITNTTSNTEEQIISTDPRWHAHAVTNFYAGLYEPVLRPHQPASGVAEDRNLDDVIRFPMPRVVMNASTGQVDLTITLAARRSLPERREFPGSNPFSVDEDHPSHPNLEAIPTRYFFQQERTDLIGADAGNAVADAIIGTNDFVQNIKADMQTLGFGDLGPANNIYARRTKWAVREFQIYSKMAHVATEPLGATGEYAQRLNQIANALPYVGPVNGYLNAMTRARIDFWKRPANRYRCPVVVTARDGAGFQNAFAGGENLWAHNDLTNTGPRMFVRDLSDYYTLPAIDNRDIQVGGNRYIVLGEYKSRAQGGPIVVASRQSWATMAVDSVPILSAAEVTLAAATTAPQNAQWSTYLTILPTIQEEATLRFDVVNAWDSNATISIPFYHYNLHAGELGGLLSFIKHEEQVTFDKAIGFFDVKPERVWPNTNDFQAKRTSDMQFVRKPGYRFEDVPGSQDEENYFKTWHWFYRFVMACRIFDEWKEAAYKFARFRIQDIRDAGMTGQPGAPNAGSGATIPQDAANNNVNIGDVFTSERAIGMLLRWHVKFPSHVVEGAANQQAGNRLWSALERAQDPAQNGNINVNWNTPVANWTNDHERALIAGIQAEGATVSTGIQQGLTDVQNFTRQGQNLDTARDSFLFHSP